MTERSIQLGKSTNMAKNYIPDNKEFYFVTNGKRVMVAYAQYYSVKLLINS